MRLVFVDDDLRRLYEDPGFHLARFGPDVTTAYRKKVQLLGALTDERELRSFKALRLEKLRGARSGTSSIRLNDQWRLILQVVTDDEGKALALIDIVDYH